MSGEEDNRKVCAGNISYAIEHEDNGEIIRSPFDVTTREVTYWSFSNCREGTYYDITFEDDFMRKFFGDDYKHDESTFPIRDSFEKFVLVEVFRLGRATAKELYRCIIESATNDRPDARHEEYSKRVRAVSLSPEVFGKLFSDIAGEAAKRAFNVIEDVIDKERRINSWYLNYDYVAMLSQFHKILANYMERNT